MKPQPSKRVAFVGLLGRDETERREKEEEELGDLLEREGGNPTCKFTVWYEVRERERERERKLFNVYPRLCVSV